MAPLISFERFSNAITYNGFPQPNRSQYNVLCDKLKASSIKTVDELAMFIAQIIHESGGLQHKKEWASQQPGTLNCAGSYRYPELDVPGRYYYGRGYIQLSWSYNYRDCSKALYRNERVLLENPDLVSDTEEGCWGSALWFWDAKVHRVWSQGFPATTNVINGGLEPAGTPGASERIRKYNIVCNAFGVHPRY